MGQSDENKTKFMYVDCVRGYAILMVIACHLTFIYAELPYPAKRLTASGWFGVQLFFLASVVTLLLSWHGEAARGRPDVKAFFIRRFFRIAPAFYLAGAAYLFLRPPPNFTVEQVLRTAAFINAMSAAWLTGPESWNVVPGDWSISVEFTFYALFPLYASLVTSLRRACVTLAGALVAAIAANLAELAQIRSSYPAADVSNFLFYWFPNQMPVFALGGVCFFLMRAGWMNGSRVLAWRARWSPRLAWVFVLSFCATAYVPLGHYLGDRPLVPALHLSALSLAGFVIALSSGRGLLVNKAAAAMGKVSFSGYLCHFAIVDLVEASPGLFHTAATGVSAIATYSVAFVVVSAITFAISSVIHATIEQPMIRTGRRLVNGLRGRVLAAQA